MAPSSRTSVEEFGKAEPTSPIAQTAASSDVVDQRSDARPTTQAPDPTPSYELMLRNLDDIRDALRVDVFDEVFDRCREDLRDLIDGRFESFSQGLQSLRAHVDSIESRLILCESRADDRSRLRTKRPDGQTVRCVRAPNYASYSTERSSATFARARGCEPPSVSDN